MLELARLVIDLAGSKARIVHKPLPENDPRQRRPDISKASAVLGWQPKTPLMLECTPKMRHGNNEKQ
jgi:UDP-glucuronate decarboxylase